MPWVEITLPTPELIFKSDGTLEWNSGLQLLMGDPAWVDIMWNAADNQLGIRAVNSATGYPINKETKASEYTIDSAESLNAAGISVDENVSGEPDSWHQKTAPGAGPSAWFGHEPIYYLTLP